MEKLTRREEELMRCFWEHGPLFVRELVALAVEPMPQLPPGAQERVCLFAQPLEAERFQFFEQQCLSGGVDLERQLVRSVVQGAGRIVLSIRLQGAGKTACDE